MLNGQIQPDRGSVKLAGEELVGLTPPQIWRRGVGRTFQITAPFASMTVVENVAMVLMSERRELFSFTRPAVGRPPHAARPLLDVIGQAGQADRPSGGPTC